MLSGVAPFAIERGLVEAAGSVTRWCGSSTSTPAGSSRPTCTRRADASHIRATRSSTACLAPARRSFSLHRARRRHDGQAVADRQRGRRGRRRSGVLRRFREPDRDGRRGRRSARPDTKRNRSSMPTRRGSRASKRCAVSAAQLMGMGDVAARAAEDGDARAAARRRHDRIALLRADTMPRGARADRRRLRGSRRATSAAASLRRSRIRAAVGHRHRS